MLKKIKRVDLIAQMMVYCRRCSETQGMTNTLLGLFMREIFLNARPPSVSSDTRRRSLRLLLPSGKVAKEKAVRGERGTSGLF